MNYKSWSFLGVITTLIFSIIIVRHFNPAPPNHLIIATGEEQSVLNDLAKKYQKILKRDGVILEVKNSLGPIDNLTKLEDDDSKVSAAFVQDGLGSEENQIDVESLGSLYYEPIWIFYRSRENITHFSELYGRKIAVGKKGYATQVLTERLLTLSAVDTTDAELINMTSTESVTALKNGTVDAAIFMLPANHPIVHDLAMSKNIKLMNIAQSEAISRKDAAFHHLVLPRGALDLEADIPNQDIDLIASTTTLLIRDDLHPALSYLLLKAASEIHGSQGIFEKRGEFPTNKDETFSLSKDALQFYKSGGSIWQRYLPYWLAAWCDRFIILVIPIVAFILPLIRLIPKLYNWRLRTHIYQRYGELKFLEMQLKATVTKDEYENYMLRLNEIEERVNKMKLPQNFSDYVYSLKGHIQYVRDRIEKTVTIQ